VIARRRPNDNPDVQPPQETPAHVYPLNRHEGRRFFLALLASLLLLGAAALSSAKLHDIFALGRCRPLGLLVGLVISAAIAYAAYWRLSKRIYTASPYGSIAGHPIEDLSGEIATWHASLTAVQARLFAKLLTEPDKNIMRISERIVPRTRALDVTTVCTLSLPSPEAVLALPLSVVPRGVLLDNIEIVGPAGQPVSHLERESVAALLAAVIRVLMSALGGAAMGNYVRDVEPSVHRYLASRDQHDEASLETVVVLLRASVRHTRRLRARQNRDVDDVIELVRAILRSVQRFMPIVVLHQSTAAPRALGTFEYARYSVRRDAVVPLGPEISNLASRMDRAKRVFREGLGVRPIVVRVPLYQATRCRSYHVEVFAPPTSYLAAQRIMDYDGKTVLLPEVAYEMRRRLGQRYSHLHLRQCGDLEACFFENYFYERSPGSIAGATMSSLAATILLWLTALTAIRRAHHAGLAASETDLIVALLAFPAVVGTWAGFEQGRQLFGGTLVARISSLVTVAVCIGGAATYVLTAPPFGGLTGHPLTAVWALVVTTTTFNSVACVGSWTLRASTESAFIAKARLR
jgi:hypothetical protein